MLEQLEALLHLTSSLTADLGACGSKLADDALAAAWTSSPARFLDRSGSEGSRSGSTCPAERATLVAVDEPTDRRDGPPAFRMSARRAAAEARHRHRWTHRATPPGTGRRGSHPHRRSGSAPRASSKRSSATRRRPEGQGRARVRMQRPIAPSTSPPSLTTPPVRVREKASRRGSRALPRRAPAFGGAGRARP